MGGFFCWARNEWQTTFRFWLNRHSDVPRLGQLLLRHNKISIEQLNAALVAQRLTGERLGQILLRQNVVTKWQIRSILLQQRMLRTASVAVTCTMTFINLFPNPARAANTPNLSVSQALAALPSVPIPTIQGTVWYVSALTGNDSNKGTSPTSAFKTIHRATDTGYNLKYKGGDVVVVMPGTYNESVRMTVSGTSQAYSTLMAMPGQARPVIVGNLTGQSGSCYGCGTIDVWASYVRISGLDVSAPDPNMEGSAINAGYQTVRDSNGVLRPQFHHFIIDHNFVHDSSCAGIAAESSDYSVITNNVVYNNANTAPNQCSGISVGYSVDYDLLSGYHNQVVDNIVFNNKVMVTAYYPPVFTCPSTKPDCHTDGNGIILDDNLRTQRSDKTPYQSKTLIFGNLSFNNGAKGVEVYSTNNVDVVNNTVYHNGNDTKLVNYPYDGAEINVQSASNVNVLNNISVPLSNTNPSISQGGSTYITYSNNITYGGTLSLQGGGSTTFGPSNISVNPQFAYPDTNTSDANFSLTKGSPAVGVGQQLPFNAIDLAGNAVTANTAINMGPYSNPAVTSSARPRQQKRA